MPVRVSMPAIGEPQRWPTARLRPVRTDPNIVIGENDAKRWNKVGARHMGDGRAEPAKHLGCNFDAGEAAAYNEHVILARYDRARRQPRNMIVK